jgi:hypothetical protein
MPSPKEFQAKIRAQEALLQSLVKLDSSKDVIKTAQNVLDELRVEAATAADVPAIT